MKLKKQELSKFLTTVTILNNLESQVIEDISDQVDQCSLNKDQLLVKKGAPGERLFIIYSGDIEVRLKRPIGGYETVQLGKGDVVGEMSLLTKSNYSADIAVTSDQVIALSLERESFLALINQYQDFAKNVTELMTKRLEHNDGIKKIGRYKLLGRIGQGSQAIVFRAYDPKLEREVAIKMLKYELSHKKRFLSRFEHEAKTIARLTHPNIVHIVEIIEAYSTRFIVMERLHGTNLQRRLKQKGALSIDETRAILIQVARALQYAHGQGKNGIVHRDIKPSNIMIDDFGNVKLTDFGIAGPPQEKDRFVEGTPAYLAPEVISEQPFDGRADIYALGVMAFHLLTASLPFSATTIDKLLEMQVTQRPPDIRNYRSDIDDNFATFIQSALEKDVDKRLYDWPTIRELLKPIGKPSRIDLADDEVGLIIRLRDSSFQQQATLVKKLQNLLKEDNLEHTLEIQRNDIKPQ